MITINTDCKYYLGYKPCQFHKEDGCLCENCQNYKKIKTRILIIKLDALGDVLRTTSILPALLDKYSQAAITWITRKRASELLKNNKYIDRIFAVEENYLEYILNEEFDLGICMDAEPLGATILNLTVCHKKMGFITNDYGRAVPVNQEANKWWLMGINDQFKRKNRQTYQELMYEICELEGPIFKPILSESLINKSFIKDFKKKHDLYNVNKKIVGINTGADTRWQWKKWISAHYIKLVRLLKNNHLEVKIVLYGGPEEIAFNREIMNELDNDIIDSGCTNSLAEFISLVSVSDIFITPDSLGFHIATSLKKTTLVLVGPTSPWELDVYGNGEIIYPEMDCVACYLNKCGKKPNCMENIKPEVVYKKIEKYLNKCE